MIQSTKKDYFLKMLLLALFISLAFIAILPFYASLIASLKPAQGIFRFGINLSLENLSFENYLTLFEGKGLRVWIWFFNTIVITILQVSCSLIVASMAGYAMAVYRFKGNKTFFILTLFALIIPVEILLVPLYELNITFGTVNTYPGVVLPFILAPFAVFFFRQYISGIPKAIIDSGRMDGCSELQIFIYLIVPLMKPAIGAMTILISVFTWNAYLWPAIILRTSEMQPLPVGLATLLSPYGNNYPHLLTGAVISVLPLIVLFLKFQKSFISGLTSGSVKG